MSEPEELKAFIPRSAEGQAAYYTAVLALDVDQELSRLLEEQGKSRRWLAHRATRDPNLDGYTTLRCIALLFLALGYHLEVRAVKNEEINDD